MANHGTIGCYTNDGCRCTECRRANTKSQQALLKKASDRTITDKQHGTVNGHRYYGCRCPACVDAYNSYNRLKPEDRKQKEKPPHGCTKMYNRGCRYDLCREASRVYRKEHKKSHPTAVAEEAKIKHRLRSRLQMAIKKNYKSGSAVSDLGCSIDEFKKHLECQFLGEMSWDNYGKGDGKWNIDHIKPLNTFDLSDRDQFLQACHYTNMRPLWHADNIKRPRDGSDIK